MSFDGGYRVSKISELEGDVSCVMVRGKKKVGFTLKFDVEVEKGP
jgi:Activator of Hsp90 ATPase, N-terminal